jgi:hypothetical protein
MKTKTIRILIVFCACLLILSVIFFWLIISLEIKFGQDTIRLYMLNDFSAISTIFLSVAIIILQFLRPKNKVDQNELLD